MEIAELRRSRDGIHKFEVKIGRKTIKFGRAGYEDFTMHHDLERKKRYLARHRARENWNRSGIYKAGFWSRWLLWNKSSLPLSIVDVNDRFKTVRIRQL